MYHNRIFTLRNSFKFNITSNLCEPTLFFFFLHHGIENGECLSLDVTRRHYSEPSPVIIYGLIFHKLFHFLALIFFKCKMKRLIPSLPTLQGSVKEIADRKENSRQK